MNCNIKIFSREEADRLSKENKTAFEGKVISVSEITEVILIEKGTNKGNTSASLFIPITEDGGYVAVNMTAAQLVSLASAALGAAARFGEVISAPGALAPESGVKTS